MSKPVDVSFFLLLVLCGQAHGGRLLLSDFNQSTSSDLISDGVHHHHRSHTFAPYLTLKNALSTEDSKCEQTYRFLPCTITMIGNLFLIPMFSFEGSGDPCFKSWLTSQALELATATGPLPRAPSPTHAGPACSGFLALFTPLSIGLQHMLEPLLEQLYRCSKCSSMWLELPSTQRNHLHRSNIIVETRAKVAAQFKLGLAPASSGLCHS